MASANDLTTFSKVVSDKNKIFDALLISFCFLAICWGAFISEEFLGYHLKMHGMYPRQPEGLLGIFTMHFLHSDWEHISQNSLGILVLNTFLFYFYRQISFKVFIRIFLFSPLLLWLIGRDSNHIGASVILYGEFAFLFASGVIRKNPLLLRVALVVILYYGSLVWYIFPVDARISWEGHASGLVVGVLLAIIYRKQGPQRKVYQFEIEPELPDDDNAYWKIPQAPKAPEQKQENTVTVRYQYKEKSKDNP
jgi:membrane associated rhomboid family serine protease